MEKDLGSLDSVALKTLYDKHLQELSDALLNGADWKDLQEQRFILTEISKLISKRGGTNNPAEYANRN